MSTFFRYQDIVINNQGIAMAGVEIYVCTQPVTTSLSPIFVPPAPLATIFSNSTGTALTQPVIVDGNGNYDFYAAQAPYTLVLHDPLDRIPDQFFPDINVISPGGGTVTSVAQTVPDGFAISGSPVTTTGSLDITLSDDWEPNTFIAGPVSGSPTTATRRALTANDIAGLVTGSVSSVDVSMTAGTLFTATSTGGPITDSGVIALTIDLNNQAANTFLAGPSSGGSGALTARAIAPADIPFPTPTTIGGVESHAATTHQFLTQIGTDGSIAAAQPNFTDISGTVAAAQLPNPSSSTLGGVQSIAPVTHNFLTSISTSGVPAQAQPTFTDISGVAVSGQLPTATSSTQGAVTLGSNVVWLVAAPALSTSTGTAGQVAFDTGFWYVCIATNTWLRTAIATF